MWPCSFSPFQLLYRRHDRGRAGLDRGPVARQVHGAQRGFVDLGVALVDAARGAAVADVMLHRRHHRHAGALQASHGGRPQQHGQFGRLAVAFVGAAPALILGDRDARTKGPVHAGGRHLDRRDPADLLDELRVARRPQPDVVGKHRGAPHVVVPVDGINPVQDRDAEPCLERLLLHPLDVGVPAFRRQIGDLGVAAAEHRSEEVLRHVGDLERAGIGLHQLADLLVERHAAHQVLDARLDRAASHPCRRTPARGSVHPGPPRARTRPWRPRQDG